MKSSNTPNGLPSKAFRIDLLAPQTECLFISSKAVTKHDNASAHVLGPDSPREHQCHLWIQGLYILVNGVRCLQQGLNDTWALVDELASAGPQRAGGGGKDKEDTSELRKIHERSLKQHDAVSELQAFYKSSRNPMERHWAPRHRPAKAISVGSHGSWLNAPRW